MKNKLNDNFELKNGGYSNYEDTTDLARHRWYYYKEGFSPNFVAKAIESSGITKNDLIIDPFNGSGTTTLSSALLGYNSIGVEVNPFTSFLSSVKVKNLDIKSLHEESAKMIARSQKGANSDLIGYSTFTYKPGLEKWLFNRNILKAFEGGWQYANSVKNIDIKHVLKLALITSAMENCNAVKDGKCLRYRETWKDYQINQDTFIESIKDKLQIIEDDVISHPISVKSKIITNDIRNVLKSKNGFRDFKLCITSPPYLNTFDYTDIYRPELFLGKFVNDNDELYNLRLKTVRSHVQAKWKMPKLDDFGSIYVESINHVLKNKDALMSKDIPLMIQAYFEDIFKILQGLLDRAANDAQVWLVVSNSAYANKEIPVDLIIGDIATKAGWYLKEIGVLRYVEKRRTKYSPDITEMRESVIILSKSK